MQGDHIVADMRYYSSRSPSRRDVIVFEKDGTFFTKRVIAIGGDTVQEKDGDVLVNGLKIDEPYIQHTQASTSDLMANLGLPSNWMINFGPVTLPKGKYFVMGDNRDVSLDSRLPEVGLLDKRSIMGKVLYIFDSDRPGKRIR